MNSTVGPIFNEKFDKKLNLWVREQCTDALFTEDQSKVAATVHLSYINSAACWGKGMKKKKKRKRRKLKTQQTQRGSKLSLNLKSLEAIWYHNLNNNFQFLNNIICIFIHFFTYTYFLKIQTMLLK